MQMDKPICGRWYWVRCGETAWFPAKADLMSATGWTNEDTWEDFQGDVSEWQLIPLPATQPLDNGD